LLKAFETLIDWLCMRQVQSPCSRHEPPRQVRRDYQHDVHGGMEWLAAQDGDRRAADVDDGEEPRDHRPNPGSSSHESLSRRRERG
jgi:hypothetical protein